MARPKKKGLSYFPLDTTMDKTNDDIEMLEAKYVKNGFKTIIKLYMKIYDDEGYFVKWNEKTSLLLAKRVNADINEVNAIINDLVHWGVFDEILYDNYKILTSKRIQETYFEAVKRRDEVIVFEEFLLINKINDNINLVNVGINPQRKEKNSKEDNIKVIKEEKKLPPKTLYLEFVLLTDNEHSKLVELLNKNIDYYIESLNNYIGTSGKKYRSHYHAIRQFYKRDKEQYENNLKGKNLLPKDIESDWLDDYIKSTRK